VKAALAVTQVTADVERNVRGILGAIAEASRARADLVLFPEAAVTGLINNGDAAHDLRLGEPIPGPVTSRLAQAAREDSIYVGLGLLELDGDSLYDSAVLLDRRGQLILKHKRISPGWRDRDCDTRVYREGDAVGHADTPLGSFAFLICGDLFEKGMAERVRDMQVDYLLYPVARCFGDGTYDHQLWDGEVKGEYVRQAALTGTTVLMVNYLATKEFDWGTFGGAMVLSPSGGILAEFPIGRTGLLVVDVPRARL
jgi:N-carbamoylputrescine amidase